MSSHRYLVIVQHLTGSELPRKSLPLSLFVLWHLQLLFSSYKDSMWFGCTVLVALFN